MSRKLNVPVALFTETGEEIPNSRRVKKLTNSDDINKVLTTLQTAPAGFIFPSDKLDPFLKGRWTPPHMHAKQKPQDEGKKDSPPLSPQIPSVIIHNVQFA